MNKLFAPFLPPWAETGLQPAFYDLESGTVLQQTARMYDKVNQLIRLFNQLSEETKTTVEEYIAKFVELKDFVDDYFDNLDVQEEINNKLDEMADDGTLAEILNDYVSGFIYDEIKVSEHTYSASGTTYYIAEIPHADNYGNAIKTKLGFSEDVISTPQDTETVRSFATRHNSTLATNAGYFSVDSESPIYHEPLGIVIRNGEVICDNSAYMPAYAQGKLQYFTIDAEGTFKAYDQNHSAQDMLDAGVKDAVIGQIPLIVDGTSYIASHPDLPTPIGFDTKDQFTVYAQKANKDVVVLVCNGDGYSTEQGLTLNQIVDILLNDYGVEFAMSLDGGGSAQMVYKDYLMNFAGDTYYTKERKVPTMLYFGKDVELNSWQQAEALDNAIAGEAKFKADNGVDFKSGFIRLTNVKNLPTPGIESYYNGQRNKLTMTNNSLYYQNHGENDDENNDIFWAKSTGLLATTLGDHAFIPNRVQYVDNEQQEYAESISDINNTTISYVPSTSSDKANGDEPYSDSYAFVITIANLDVQRSQIALPVGSGADNHLPVRRIYNPDAETWGAWKEYGTSGWVAIESTKGSFEWKRQGNIVNIRGTVNSGQSGSLGNVPNSIKPASAVNGVATASGNLIAKCYVTANGGLGLNTPDTAGSYSINLTYML